MARLRSILSAVNRVGQEDASAHNPGGYARRLRQELVARGLAWAEQENFRFEQSYRGGSSLLFEAEASGRHGNFHPAAYRQILKRAEWRSRLEKRHTTAHRILAYSGQERSELDSCSSSDALLMNVFCHPLASAPGSRLRSFLSLESEADLCFGYRPRVPMQGGRIDCTEIDLKVGDLILEAKLTEADFQTANWKLAARYRDLQEVFDGDLLPVAEGKLISYQLVRGILAAFAEENCRYCLICDERRPDLIERWFAVLGAMRHPEHRWRCTMTTWQELTPFLPKTLAAWLAEKYGIVGR